MGWGDECLPPAWGEIPLSCLQGKGVSLTGQQAGAVSSRRDAKPVRSSLLLLSYLLTLAGGGFAISGERDVPWEHESGRGMVGLHQGGGRGGEQDSQTCAPRLIWRQGDGGRGVGRGHEALAAAWLAGWGVEGSGTALRCIQCGVHALMWVHERAGQKKRSTMASCTGWQEGRSPFQEPCSSPFRPLRAARETCTCGACQEAAHGLVAAGVRGSLNGGSCCPAGCCCAPGGRRRWRRRRREGCESGSGM